MTIYTTRVNDLIDSLDEHTSYIIYRDLTAREVVLKGTHVRGFYYTDGTRVHTNDGIILSGEDTRYLKLYARLYTSGATMHSITVRGMGDTYESLVNRAEELADED